MRRWVVWGLVLLGCQSRPLVAGTPTPFRLAEQGGILVAVMLNGTGPFTMAIDTGANHSAIAEDVAIRIGAPAIAQAIVTSSAGSRMRTLVRVQRLAFGPITAGADATVLPRDALAAMGAFDGVIGQDVLAALRYTIDFDSRQIVWHDEPASVAGSRAVLTMTFHYGRFLVELPQRGSVLRLVPDSGAGGLILFQGAGRVLPDPLSEIPARSSIPSGSVIPSGIAIPSRSAIPSRVAAPSRSALPSRSAIPARISRWSIPPACSGTRHNNPLRP